MTQGYTTDTITLYRSDGSESGTGESVKETVESNCLHLGAVNLLDANLSGADIMDATNLIVEKTDNDAVPYIFGSRE